MDLARHEAQEMLDIWDGQLVYYSNPSSDHYLNSMPSNTSESSELGAGVRKTKKKSRRKSKGKTRGQKKGKNKKSKQGKTRRRGRNKKKNIKRGKTRGRTRGKK